MSLPIHTEGEVLGLFVQDSWQPTPSLVVKPGLRFDTVAYDTAHIGRIADFGLLQPRIGVAWDLGNRGTQVLMANIDEAKRDYDALIARFELRTQRASLFASYTFSHSEGSSDTTADEWYNDLMLEPRGSHRGEPVWQVDLQLDKGFHIGPFTMSGILTVLNLFNEEGPTKFNQSEFIRVPWRQPTEYQRPRRWEIGLRLEF